MEFCKWVGVVGGFVFLDMFLNGVPRLLHADGMLWVGLFVLFFMLVHLTAKWSGVTGLTGVGLQLGKGRGRQWGIGMLIGIAFWILLYLIKFGSGLYQFDGWKSGSFLLAHVPQAFVVALLGSASNCVLIRGYVFAHLRGRVTDMAIVWISTGLYVLDDCWNEGFEVGNMLFSLLLGITLALTVVRTASIWMSIGIHTGSNLVYWTLFGFQGSFSGILQAQVLRESALLSTSLAVGVVFLMLLFVSRVVRKLVPQ